MPEKGTNVNSLKVKTHVFYMEAFAAPLIGYDKGKHTVIIAAMPKNYEELGNKPWQKNDAIKGCPWEIKSVADKDELKAALDSIGKCYKDER